jgi:predicted O-methyltransferase YrrM
MPVLDPTAQAVVDGLHAQTNRQMGAVIGHMLPKLPQFLLGRPIGGGEDLRFYDDKLLSIGPSQGELLYFLARARGVRRAVEFGASFGVSTIYLDAALRDAATGGHLVSTELSPRKAAAARANLAAAGLADHVEILEGDARTTLAALPGPVDLLLLDGWPALGMDVLRIVEPRLADGAIVVVDNVGQFAADLRPVIDRLTASPNYRASQLPLRGGTLVGVYNASPAGPPQAGA